MSTSSDSREVVAAINVRDAHDERSEQPLRARTESPGAALRRCTAGEISLGPGLFRDRRQLVKDCLLRLTTPDLLQNHLLEAGVRIDTEREKMHQGWESPHCQLRGHFAGHWLSAAAQFAALDDDSVLAGRANEVVGRLKYCQRLNGGQWVGSIPEKYFAILAEEERSVWSPQYTVHKTMMGLMAAYQYGGNEDALAVLRGAADWFLEWTGSLRRDGRGDVIYAGECSGMLELWADLYEAAGDERYLTLASRYSAPKFFGELLDHSDPLTHTHCNASIPWIHGAARLYEITGDTRVRDIVRSFYEQAANSERGFVTTGCNAGEFWIPPGRPGWYLGRRTQEHCTVYNMIRVAESLLRWTGEARYADYIERALYNGILAQQNPNTGMVCYFLPLQPGAKKVWGSERHDFWCCHGTLIQAHAMIESLIYHRASDGVAVCQFVDSELSFGEPGQRTRITQSVGPFCDVAPFQSRNTGELTIKLDIETEHKESWVLRIRQPEWAREPGVVSVEGEVVEARLLTEGFLEQQTGCLLFKNKQLEHRRCSSRGGRRLFPRASPMLGARKQVFSAVGKLIGALAIEREWTRANVQVSFSKTISRVPQTGDERRFAFVDGPIVLAALGSQEHVVSSEQALTLQFERQYIEARPWRTEHYWLRTPHGTVALKPRHEIVDEQYTVHLTASE